MIGVGQRRQHGLVSTLWRRVRGPAFDDLAAAEAILKVSGLPWIIVRPAHLTNGPPGEQLRSLEPGEARPRGVSRADFARFVIELLGQRDFIGHELIVSADPD